VNFNILQQAMQYNIKTNDFIKINEVQNMVYEFKPYQRLIYNSYTSENESVCYAYLADWAYMQ